MTHMTNMTDDEPEGDTTVTQMTNMTDDEPEGDAVPRLPEE